MKRLSVDIVAFNIFYPLGIFIINHIFIYIIVFILIVIKNNI